MSNDLPRVYDQIAFPLHAISINNSDYTVRTYFSSAHVGSRELLVVGSTCGAACPYEYKYIGLEKESREFIFGM
jgi:hypothetical protein